ncbi:MFS transporter [Chitinivorax sp. PXF-14]|uniref:MFS transporter n=1 Tax=Chitinivorax sp. PXF-14 TaxID=3230488 RepID=UPI0034658495
MKSSPLSAFELRASASLAGIYSLRMFGMFLILPIFALYAPQLKGGDNHALVGIALGAYGLTQAILQLPFGMLSDRIGRKKVIYLGLVLMAIGSLICASADNIYVMIAGRAVQGAGAISAAITALLADLTREEHRTQAMAMIGMSIGLTFAASLAAGPAMYHYLGMPGIFVLIGVLSMAALIGVWKIVPTPTRLSFHSDAEANPATLKAVLREPQLLRLNYGIFALHAAQMAMFTVMPLVLKNTGGLDASQHWKVYLPIMAGAFIFMIPAIIYGEKKARLKQVFVAAIGIMLAAQAGMALALDSFWNIVALLALYFLAFNILEATLPSLISKIAPAQAKGTAIGVYNATQSFGTFLGGALGGWLYKHYGTPAVFGMCSTLMLGWLVIASSMQAPLPVKTQMFHIGDDWQGDPQELSKRLGALRGVKEAVVIAQERVAYLKVLQQDWDEAGVLKLIQETN